MWIMELAPDSQTNSLLILVKRASAMGLSFFLKVVVGSIAISNALIISKE